MRRNLRRRKSLAARRRTRRRWIRAHALAVLLNLLEDLAAIAVLDIRFAASLDLPINRPPKFARGWHAVAKSGSPAARFKATVQEKIVRYRIAETGTRAMTRQSFVQASGIVRAPAEF